MPVQAPAEDPMAEDQLSRGSGSLFRCGAEGAGVSSPGGSKVHSPAPEQSCP